MTNKHFDIDVYYDNTQPKRQGAAELFTADGSSRRVRLATFPLNGVGVNALRLLMSAMEYEVDERFVYVTGLLVGYGFNDPVEANVYAEEMLREFGIDAASENRLTTRPKGI